MNIFILNATVADGRDVYPGQTVDVSPKAARELVQCGFAVPVDIADRDAEVLERGGKVEPPPLFVRSDEAGRHEVRATPFPKPKGKR